MWRSDGAVKIALVAAPKPAFLRLWRLLRCVRCRRSRLASAVRRSFDVPAGGWRGEGRFSREHFSIRILRPSALFCTLHARLFGVAFAENAGDVQHALARLSGSSQKHVTRSDFPEASPQTRIRIPFAVCNFSTTENVDAWILLISLSSSKVPWELSLMCDGIPSVIPQTPVAIAE